MEYFTAYPVHIPSSTYILIVPPPVLVCRLVTVMAYFVYSYLLVGLIFTYYIVTCERTSGYLFSTYTSSCWPIFFIKNFLIADSIHKPLHGELFSIIKNSSSHSLYTCDFKASFVSLLFLGGLMLHVRVNLVTYSVHIPTVGDLFSTYGPFWLPILYTNLSMLTYSL